MNSFETLVGIAFVKCNLLLVGVWLAWAATPVTALRARVGLWRVAIVGSMFLMAASLTGPTLRLPWLPSSSSPSIEAKQLQAKPLDSNFEGTTSLSQETPVRIEDDQDTKFIEAESIAPQATDTANVPQSQRAISFATPDLSSMIGIVWFAGSLLLGFRFVRQWRYHAWLIANSALVDAPLTELANAVSNLRNSRELRRFELRWTKQLNTPAVTGVLKPVILLPESWREAPTEKLQAALAHELAHIQSRDIVWSAVIELFRVVTWPSPLVWGIAAAHRSACERLADYQAWNAIGDRANYRSMLANLALEMMGSKSRFALSMVRTPQILDRLKLMENLKTNNRLGLGNKLIQAALFTMGLLIGTAAVVPRTLMPRVLASIEPQETEKPPQSTVQATDANQDPATTPKVSFKQAATFNRDTILVLDPDGTPAKDAVYIVTGRIDYQLDDYAVPSVAPKALPVDSQLKLDMPEDEFIAVWNANGFCQYTVSRLSKLESLKLQPWCKLTVHLRDGQLPLQDFRVSARLTLTTDGMFQGICFKNFGVTDDQGSVTFDRLPPGELEIAAEPVDSGATKIAVKRSKYLFIAAGATQQLTIGDQGRGVTGRVFLPQGIDRSEYSKLEGRLINQTTADWLTFPIGDDGIFKTDRVPEGECTISVRTSWTERVRRLWCNKSVTLSADASELNGRQFIGTIAVSAESDRVANDGTFDSTPIQANDAFVSDEKVAWITTTKLPEGEVYVLKSAAGKTIRTLDEDFMHVSFGRNKQNVAIDATRNRVYILANGAKQSSCSLLVLDLNGKQLCTVPLKPNGYNLTLDPETGNIWMTATESIGKTELTVFDSSGKPLQKYNYDDGTAISYSSMDKAIWMAGAKKIVKIDPATGKILASFTLPKGCWNCTYSLASPNGGVLAFELNHPDMPLANNRIWYIDSDGNARANIELGDFLVTSAGLVRNELWVSGFRFNRLWSQSSASLDYRLVCFDLQLNQLNDVELPYQLLHANQDGQAAWVRQGDADLQVTFDADRKLKVLNKVVR